MYREKFFEWLNQYEGTYKFIEDDYGEVTIKFLVEEIQENINQDYKDGWRYIVWVGGNDDYYKNYNDAKRDADEWIAKGYDDVIIEEIIKK